MKLQESTERALAGLGEVNQTLSELASKADLSCEQSALLFNAIRGVSRVADGLTIALQREELASGLGESA